MRNILLTLLFFLNSLLLLKAQDTLPVCPSPEEVEKNSLLKVYPNPSDGTFQVVYASLTECPPPGWGGLLMINIMDQNGQIVYTESIADFEGEYNQIVDLSDKPKGTYVIEVITGKQKKVKREELK